MKILKIIVLLCLSIKGLSQDNKLNLIIFLNDELVDKIYDFKVIVNDSIMYDSDYVIGNLTINENFEKQVFEKYATSYFKLNFKVYNASRYNSSDDKYEVVLQKGFIEKKFIVIRLYNLDSKKYKKRIKKNLLQYDYNIYADGLYLLNL